MSSSVVSLEPRNRLADGGSICIDDYASKIKARNAVRKKRSSIILSGNDLNTDIDFIIQETKPKQLSRRRILQSHGSARL